MKKILIIITSFLLPYLNYGQSYVTYKFGEIGQIQIPIYWTIFDGQTDIKIINEAVIASKGKYQPTPGKYTIVRCNGNKGSKTFTLKLSYTVLENSQSVSELRAQKSDIIEMLDNELVSLKQQVIGSDIKIIKSLPTEYIELGGGIGGKMSYIKQWGSNPQRKIVQYMLFKENKMFLLTLGWDVADEIEWSTEYKVILNSLRL